MKKKLFILSLFVGSLLHLSFAQIDSISQVLDLEDGIYFSFADLRLNRPYQNLSYSIKELKNPNQLKEGRDADEKFQIVLKDIEVINKEELRQRKKEHRIEFGRDCPIFYAVVYNGDLYVNVRTLYIGSGLSLPIDAGWRSSIFAKAEICSKYLFFVAPHITEEVTTEFPKSKIAKTGKSVTLNKKSSSLIRVLDSDVLIAGGDFLVNMNNIRGKPIRIDEKLIDLMIEKDPKLKREYNKSMGMDHHRNARLLAELMSKYLSTDILSKEEFLQKLEENEK